MKPLIKIKPYIIIYSMDYNHEWYHIKAKNLDKAIDIYGALKNNKTKKIICIYVDKYKNKHNIDIDMLYTIKINNLWK